MAIYLCHTEPAKLEFETAVVDSRPGAVALASSWLHPGGGGQPADRAVLEWRGGTAAITGVEVDGDRWWHRLDTNGVVDGTVRVAIDADHRARIAQLHTDTHILNALVFQEFDGALVTGAKISDGSAHLDFDLPEADNDRLRNIEDAINAVIREGLHVRATYLALDEAQRTPGIVRNLTVAPPPTPDGMLRVIEIAGLDRQACGGTHLTNTGESLPIRITKVDNKGRRNRRVTIALVTPT
ncbi:MAG: alanyl-tRNA editing protein [Candidatus Eremiobacteraeota bacterium]|nr:alanyl-tRNA editing protein [Candidatus Eremiobacteraeota bacterium]